MALTVKTNTYLSVADADSYWADRNNSTWANATNADKEKALREATQYLDGAFSFIGEVADFDQALAWPRVDAVVRQGNFKGKLYDSDELPQFLQDATAELALEALDERLRPSQDRGGAVKREKVDVIEVEYMDFAPSQKSFDFVKILLKPILANSGHNKTLLRT